MVTMGKSADKMSVVGLAGFEPAILLPKQTRCQTTLQPPNQDCRKARTQPVFSCHDHVGSNFHLVFAYIQDFGRDLSVPLH
jgi:hypothetical protein